ncbi:MAG TPA: hypothetical protein VHF91_02535 [Acidimicrobiales bacterium]|nr:hypothetical protein [Acidimicrobiales bacterium]
MALGAAACSDIEEDFALDVEEERTEAGSLEALIVDGSGFTPNGPVLVTLVLSATGGNARPYVEETIQADGNGEFRFERRPPSCPQPADYESGSWTLVVARDMTEGISGSETLSPGAEPDCRGSAG